MTTHTNTATGIDPAALDKLEVLARKTLNSTSTIAALEALADFQGATNPATLLKLIALARRAEQTATGTGERFFMDHGLWHDRLTGQHLFTQDQYDEQWRDMYRAGQEDAAIGHNMLGGGALKRTATGAGATHEQLSTNPDTLSTNQAGLSGNLDAGTGDADERALFEHSERASNLKRDSEGDYENPCVQSAWEGWQARAALAKQAAAPAEQSGGDSEREFIVVDDDLQAFLDAAVDWVRGKPQNMDTGLYMFDLLQRLEDRLAGNTAPVVDGAGAQAAAQPDTSKAIYWFSVLTKCARLLNLDTETPIPSGVLAAVEKLTTTPATAQDDARNAAQSDNALARMERAEWSAVSNALRDARAHLCKDGVRHTWLDGAVTLAEERAKGIGTYAAGQDGAA